MSIGRCKHPRCRDSDGNPRLTAETICEPCRNHLGKQLDWLKADYANLKQHFPKPATGERPQIKTAARTYGHPAEWASDMARAIARNLNRLEDDARADLGEPPGFNHATARESSLVESAHRYLTTRLHRIIDASADTAEDLAATVHDLHRTVRRTLGYNRQVQRLPGARCPSCDHAALTKTVGQVDCGYCGRIITEDEYDRLAAILAYDALNALIAQHEATRQRELA